MKKQHFFLIFVMMVASLSMRLYQLGSLPKILNRDEAALAYNAVLLSETGKDEWNRPWPLALESFGDYKLPGYVLTLVTLFKVLPKEDWVVRLPAVVAGISLIPLSYWLALNWKYNAKVALIISFFASVSPVFFFYSRIAFEALLALSLWVFFLGLVFKRSDQPKVAWRYDLAAVVVVILAAFTYNTPFLLLPFIIVLIPLSRGLHNWKNWVGVTSALLVVFVGLAMVFLSLTSQKSTITLFGDETTLTNSIRYRQSLPTSIQPLVGNKYVYLTGLITKNIVFSFGPYFLVQHGGNHPWHALVDFGHMGWVAYGLGLLGLARIFYLCLKKTSTSWATNLLSVFQSRQFVIVILLITSLIPSVITIDAPHTTRSLPFLFWWLFMIAEGVTFISDFRKNKIIPKMIFLLVVIAALEFGWYSFKYFTDFPNRQSEALRVGFDQMIKDIEQQYPDRPVAIVDGDGFHYILTAWYLQLPPEEYFETVVRQQPNQLGFRYGQQVANYHYIGRSSDREKTNETVMLEWKDNQWQLYTF
jgi:4-amino-4-deoxy-L-arabinose transferase-like glycosyltransferase